MFYLLINPSELQPEELWIEILRHMVSLIPPGKFGNSLERDQDLIFSNAAQMSFSIIKK
jgi:hypothetical protein